jgi:putative methyltransferase (TIGR04325 family)
MRIENVRLAANVVRGVSRVSAGQSLLNAVESNPLGHSTLDKLLAFRRPFGSLADAERAIADQGGSDHENPANAATLMQLNESARPSDYAALYHIEKVMPAIHRVFDLGGNVGNLFYCYAKYLEPLEHVQWMVMDLPGNLARGRELAQSREAAQLVFTESWTDASGADLLIASGCLHYFEETIAQLLVKLETRPLYVLINRAAFTEGLPVATVQDNGAYFTACMLHNRETVIRGLRETGYLLEDQWRAPELSLEIPGHPEHRIESYTGMFLRRADVSLPAAA